MSHWAHTLALFAHIAGVLMLFAGIGISTLALSRWRRAETLAELRLWAGVAEGVEKIMKPASGILIVAGFYLAHTGGLWTQPWMVVSIVATFLQLAMGPLVLAPSVKGLMAQAEGAPAEPVSPALRARMLGLPLWGVLGGMHGAGAAIALLMVAKSGDWAFCVGAWVVLVAAGVLGHMRPKAPPAASVTEQSAA